MFHCHFEMIWTDQILEWFHEAVFFFTTSSAFSVQVEKPSTTSIYTLEKLVFGEVHLSVLSWLDSTPLDRLGQLGSMRTLGGCLTDKWNKRIPLALSLLGGLFFWGTFLVFFVGLWPLNEWWHVSEVKLLSHVWLFVTQWTVAYQAPVVHGIFQARVLEWVAISFSRGSFQPRDQTWVSHIAGRCFTI